MKNKILLVVEGKKDEPDILLDVLKNYGIKAVNIGPINVETIGNFDLYKFDDNKDLIVIAAGPRNRIHDFLMLIKKKDLIIERFFNFSYASFHSIFLIYDVDHNDCDDVEEMFSYFCDESKGMLLLNSPCLEVLADYDRDRKLLECHRLTEYKTLINNYYNGQTKNHIKQNFNQIMIYFLKKNVEDFKEENVMEHPHLVLEKVNKLNERVNMKDKKLSYVRYRYFTTVLYVAIANALNLTREIKNYRAILNFFEKMNVSYQN